MGRRNSSVKSKNRRLDRREKGTARTKQREVARVRVDDLVMPDGQCRFQSPRRPKARFSTKEKAAKALEQAIRQRARMGSTHVEKRYYQCPEGGCGGFHLTSREEFDEDIWKRRRAQHEERMNP